MQIYVHRSGTKREFRMELREVEGSTPVTEAVELVSGERVWLQEGEAPIDHTESIQAAGIGDRDHIHVSTCPNVAVTVSYNNDPKAREFPPAASIQGVFEWAAGPKGFNLSKEDTAELVLQVCGNDEQPQHSDHVGSFVTEGTCDVCLQMVPQQVIQG